MKYNNFLTDFNDPENIYLLGYLWADGCIQKYGISLEIKEEDFIDIEHIFIKYGINKFKVRQRMRDGKLFGKPQKSVYISGKELATFLIENDYKIKSQTTPTKILSKIPEELKHYFWRGFFDGDGCFYMGDRNEIAFWGTENQDWADLTNLLNKLEINYTYTKYKRKSGKHCSSCLIFRKREFILSFGSYIWSGYKIGLNRKYNKFLQFKEKLKTMRVKNSQYHGIVFNIRNNKWGSFVHKNKINNLSRDKFLGWFKTEIEAKEIRNKYIKDNNIQEINHYTNFEHQYNCIL